MRLVQIFAEQPLQLGGNVAVGGREPKRFANLGCGPAEPFHAACQFGPLVRFFHTADRHQTVVPAAPHQEADAVALQEPPPFIDDRKSRPTQVEAGVDLPGELVELRRVVGDLLELAQLAVAMELGNDLADDFEKS